MELNGAFEFVTIEGLLFRMVIVVALVIFPAV